ncbi:hypothetical protein QC761_0089860 [Podospora bellae-mahoneyi]|uniref:Uncharacterized protein n=1 Tax=Podospora bellae-mahoneyi TaxID=2093777 RepID=A0ABR0F8D6_9PEZI|nr:hypothetical protein QC761_0089860 [Podospora bellae-mahoneyi]
MESTLDKGKDWSQKQ